MNTRILVSIALAALLSACASGGGYNNQRYSSYDDRARGYDGYARCYDCGVVERIERVYGERRSGGGGAVLGGIIGGVLGNQVGSGDGRKAATVAGAIAGGIAGNTIEKNNNAAPMYELFVRMDDGRRLVVSQRDLRGIREGSAIRVSGNRAYLQ
jgi:outer membrane lipoprotein SlyB